MPRNINVPDFDFAGAFYYPEVLERLVSYLREEVPEITNESPGEPAMQLLAAMALVAHLSNTRLDMVAHESLLPTAQLTDSIINHLRLIDFTVPGDIPAESRIVAALSRTYTATTLVLPALSLFSTKRTGIADPILFENLEAVTISRTDEVTGCYVYDASANTFTDRTTQANTTSSTFAVLPATPAAGDALYIGHDTVMCNRIRFSGMTTATANVTGVWEYSDDTTEDSLPDTVVDIGSALRMNIDTLLGNPGVSRAGLEVVVTYAPTGATETVTSLWDGSNNYVNTTSIFNQAVPSTVLRDYSVGTAWHEVPGLDDETSALTVNGDMNFTLPKTTVNSWEPVEINSQSAFWIRYRVISVSGSPIAGVFDRAIWNTRDTFIQADVIQGETISNKVLGSSDATASQQYTLSESNVIAGTVVVSVDSVAWTEVHDFYNSTLADEHYTTSVDSEGVGTVIFGDGVNGKIPPSGSSNLVAEYRIRANLDGNVGAGTIITNRSGVAGIRSILNWRAASGWQERRGSTVEDRERLKLEGPASLRTLKRAVTVEDFEFLSVNDFLDSAGTRPFERAHAIELGFGPKTVKVVVVGTNGDATDSADRLELETYFNGDESEGIPSRIVANQKAFVVDYSPRVINIVVNVLGGDQDLILAALDSAVRPLAKLDDGTYRWRFGSRVSPARLSAIIANADPDVVDVDISTPAAVVELEDDELPELGTVTITITPVTD